MESVPVPLCKGEIILNVTSTKQLHELKGEECPAAAVLVSRLTEIQPTRAKLKRPVGVVFDAVCEQEEDLTDPNWTPNWLIDYFKHHARRVIAAEPDFVYLRMNGTLRELRAAVLAFTDLCGIGLFAELSVEEDACTDSGESLLAVIGILQRIGVAGVMLAGVPEEVDEALSEIAPHARMSLGVSIRPEEIGGMQELSSAGVYLATNNAQAGRLRDMIPPNDDSDEPDADRDYFLAPVGAHVHFVDATIDISEPMDLEDHFGERLLELEDEWSGAIKLEINQPEDIYLLAEYQYMLERPVCLDAENPELLELALRVFDGIALYDGTWELDRAVYDYFSRHYGLTAL